jgi:iron complex transport system substrate-binding protein
VAPFSRVAVLALVALVPLACSEGNGGAAREGIVVEDGLGREVHVERAAGRIVSLAPAHTEILFALGVGDRLRGRDSFSDHPPESLEIPSIGSAHPRPNLESILLIRPDLALAGGTMDPTDVRAMERMGIPVYASGVAASLEDVYADLLAVSRLCGLPG